MKLKNEAPFQCKYCKKEIPEKNRRLNKKFCNASCRNKHWINKHPRV